VPEYRLDSAERYLPTTIEGRGGPVVYGREADGWLQYWTYYAYNPQDRGILKTGRHEGDWEVVQVRRGRAVFAQHSWSESCAVHGRPVVYVANGSHAAYFERGKRNRPWPDPNDYANGRGRRIRPRLVRITRDSPAWMRRAERWGSSRAGWVPGEQSSPQGPAFQRDRFDHPAAFAATARACGSGAPGRPWVPWVGLGAVAAALAAVAYGRRQFKLGS
jgi:hypothetical protein